MTYRWKYEAEDLSFPIVNMPGRFALVRGELEADTETELSRRLTARGCRMICATLAPPKWPRRVLPLVLWSGAVTLLVFGYWLAAIAVGTTFWWTWCDSLVDRLAPDPEDRT